MVEISFVIVNWNTKEVLSLCIQSLIMYSPHCDTEIIVVDNGSTDGSQEHVRKNFPEVLLLENKVNLGYASGCNKGIHASSGAYICLLNSDIIIQEGGIERMREYMDSHPSIAVLGPRFLGPDGSSQTSCRLFPSLWNEFCAAIALHRVFPNSRFFSSSEMDHISHDRILQVEVLAGALWFVRRQAIDEAGLLDERFFMYGEDSDWCKTFWDAGWEIVYFPLVEVIHRHGASSSIDPVRFYIEQYRAGLQYWRKHHGLFARIGIRAIGLFHNSIRLLVYSSLYALRISNNAELQINVKRSARALLFLSGIAKE
jgi:GT2 family glycosyltransferase